MINEQNKNDIYYVYILECADGTYYTGITNDLIKRLKTHNLGKASKYTKVRLPVKFVYTETCSDKSSALRREIEIKKLSRKDKQSLIQDNPLSYQTIVLKRK